MDRRRSSGSSAAPPRRQKRFVVEPTPENQVVYNRIYNEVMRKENNHQRWLHPNRSAPMSRASSSSGTSPAAATETSALETGDPQPRRPRGRRDGPLDAETRFKTALRRTLKLVCDDCRSRRVACECFDISKLKEACRESRRSSSNSAVPSRSRPRSRVRSSSGRREDLIGLNEPATYSPFPPSIADSDWDDLPNFAQPANTRSDVQLYASQFNARTLLPGAIPTPAKSTPYTPALGNSADDGMAFLGAGFPVGSEIAEEAGRWQCEFVANSVRCSWTGPVSELSQHWKDCHHAIREEESWCECTRCLRLRIGWDKPYLCLDPACSPTGAVWKRLLYGHTLVESTVASTPILTQSSESENGSYDPGAPWNPGPSGSREGSFFLPDAQSGNWGSFFGYQHGSDYQKESHWAEDSGESGGHAHEHSVGSPSGLPASKNEPLPISKDTPQPSSKSEPPPISKDTPHAACAPPRPSRVSLGFLCYDALHPPVSLAKKMPPVVCTLAAAGAAMVFFEPRLFLGANTYITRALATALTMPWISFFLICCSFAVTWLVQTWWSAVPFCLENLAMRNAVLRRVPVSQPDSNPQHLRPHRQTRRLSGGFDTVAAVV